MSSAGYSIFSSLYKRLILQPLGLSRENSMVLWLLMLFGAITAGSLWYFQGTISVVIVILYLCGICLLSFLRLDFSFYVLVFAVLIFDQFSLLGFDPFTYQVGFFKELREISYVPFFDAGVVNMVEVQLGFITVSLLFLLAIKKNFSWKPIPVFIPFMIFFLFFAGAFVNGLSNGGDVWTALWETRAFCYFFIFYLMVPQIIRNKEQIQILVWIFIVGISFKAVQGIGRFIERDFAMGELQPLTNSEDTVFLVTLFMLLIGFLVLNVKNQQRLFLLVISPLLMLGFYLGFQGTVYIAFIVTLVTFVLLLPVQGMGKFIKYSLPILVGLMGYGFFFWNNPGRMGQPIQTIKTSLKQPIIEVTHHDYAIYNQKLEDYGLVQTSSNKWIFGSGFGQKINSSASELLFSSPYGGYISQNEFFWILIKLGVFGFFVFWFFFNAYAAKAVSVLQRLEDSYLKVVLMVAVVAIMNQMVVSYFDLQLMNYRSMIYLGCLMGLLPAIEQYAKEVNKSKSARKLFGIALAPSQRKQLQNHNSKVPSEIR